MTASKAASCLYHPSDMITLPLWVAGLVGAFIIILIAIIWSLQWRQRPNLEHARRGSSGFLPTMAGLLQTTIVTGNRVELIQNGAFFDRLFADLEAATTTINLETFLSRKGKITRRLTDILVKRAAEGVEVRVLLDGSGGRRFGRHDLKRLVAAGCSVSKYHPFNLHNLGRFNQRTHRKMVIIDGRVGYIGGHCLVDNWLGDAEDKKHFRDITARIEGPIVNQLQSAFTDNWVEETMEVIAGDTFFPELEPCGPTPGQIVFISPIGGPSTLKLLHYLAINEAQESITVQNPYFLPDPDARKALLDAVTRGVEVRVMIPATHATDAKLVSHASHHHYGTLLKGGVRLFDYQRTLLHQKVFVIDHRWSSVGSTNFDDRSFEINDEVSLVTFDEDIAKQLEDTFERDLQHAKERHFGEWSKRNPLHKLVDGSAFLLHREL